MNELITLHFDRVRCGEAFPVDARELHSLLQVGAKFADWVKDRIDENDYVEDRDYITQVVDSVVNPKLGENGNLRMGRPRIDYALSLDMAKEVAMMERNEMGRTVRRYFIECERKATLGVAQIRALQRELLRNNPRLVDVLNLKRVGYSQCRIAKMLRFGASTIHRDVKKLKECGFDLSSVPALPVGGVA